jgi:alcohol dehydrogenase
VRILGHFRRGRLPLDKLISHRFTLDEIPRGFEMMRTGELLRAVIEP